MYGAELNVVDVESNIVFKNKEYPLFDQEYVVYDTETTGLNSGIDQMIEIGAVKVKMMSLLIDLMNLLLVQRLYLRL